MPTLASMLRGVLCLTAAVTVSATLVAQPHKRTLITGPISDAERIVVRGNVRPEATAVNDRGARSGSAALTGLLVLHRSQESELAFQSYLSHLNDPASASYHKWLSNREIGETFGPSAEDLARVSGWLADNGLTAHAPSPDGSALEFEGTVAQVSSAFHTSIHNLSVEGENHFANMSDPEIPAALAPLVTGVASLNDFQPKPMSHLVRAPEANGIRPSGSNYLSAADLATIYNFKPLYAQGITGRGQTIALIENTDLYSVGDWQVFRKAFGLARAYPYGTLTQLNPTGTNTCTDPGVNTNDTEAAIDVEWSLAAAPNAAIINASCRAAGGVFGGFIALANMLQSANPPQVVSISYGSPETSLGASYNAYISNLYATAAAQGVSVFVSSGDSSAAASDRSGTTLVPATHGIAISGFQSTPYNISVGGTDFGYTPLGTPGVYFNSTNGTNFQTANTYIPEVPWNDSCAGSLYAAYLGFPSVGPNSLCNSGTYINSVRPRSLQVAGGGGGPSACAFGTRAVAGVVGGTCAGYPKPSWQNLLGVPNDGVRDTPDVSLMASNGFWGTSYAVCISDASQGFSPCSGDPATWAGYGGTSISSPIWAGIQALVNQATAQSWGNSNPVLYSLARSQYGSSGSSACNSSLGNAVGPGCVFYDVTQGDNVGLCTGTINCFNSGGMYGSLSVSSSTFQPAYPATVGWDFATGIGTTNATNIVNAWTAYASRTAAQ